MLIRYFIFLGTTLSLISCGEADTKEFFFGSRQGPDPFVIGSTLTPLKPLNDSNDLNNHQKTLSLPKPQASLPISQLPSRAQKAKDLLNLDVQNVSSNKITQGHNLITGTITSNKATQSELINNLSHNNNIIDFHTFDTQMKNTYEKQSQSGYLISDFLGSRQSIDPTIREKMNEKK